MPTLSTFYGIAIRMYFRDHVPPHFHALYGDDEALMATRIERVGEAIMTAWHASRGDFGYTAQARDRLSSHLARVPLFSAGT